MSKVPFVHDPRRVMQAAIDWHVREVDPDREPIRVQLVSLLEAGVKGMDEESHELSALHHVFRMALVILGKDAEYRAANDLERQSRAVDRILDRLTAAYDLDATPR